MKQTLAGEDEYVIGRFPKSALQIVERATKASQLTSERTFGIPRRPFLESLPAFIEAGGTVARLGKLRIVSVEDYSRWIDTQGVTPQRDVKPSNDVEDGADVLRRELGIVGGGK